MKQLDYVVTVPSELSAGLRGFTETVSVTFHDTDKAIDDNELQKELTDHFREAIAAWFDVAPRSVATLHEYSLREPRPSPRG